jgi:hypothetical protein
VGPGDESGQATIEWVGLILLAAVVLVAALAAAGARLPGAGLARTIAERIACAVSLSHACQRDPALVAAYGEEVAQLVRRHAPRIAYETGMTALPVDFRRCRSTACGDGRRSGIVSRSAEGEPVAAFVHVVDCRPAAVAASVAAGLDCSGPRAGNAYLQYWFYYADSATLRDLPVAGAKGFHPDDWESYQVRVGGPGVDVRASSHHGYNYALGNRNWASDAGIGPVRSASEAVGLRPKGGWGPETGWLFVSGGSHAGNAKRDPVITRATLRRRLILIPVEPLASGTATFSIVPPWLKPVYHDPESDET